MTRDRSDEEEFQYQLDLAIAESLSLADPDFDPLPTSTPAPTPASQTAQALPNAGNTPNNPTQSSTSSFWKTISKILSPPPPPTAAASAKKPTITPPTSNTSSSSVMDFLPLSIPSMLSSRLCGGCHQPIALGRYLIFQGQEYHPSCFLCAGCGLPIQEGQPFAVSALSSPSSPGRERAYHPTCFQELFSPHCTLCHAVLDGCTVLKHPFFEKEVYCMEHISNPQCCSCQRRLRLEGVVDLLDGRSLCSFCSKTIIMENSEAAEVFQEVLVYLRQELQVDALPADLLAVPVLTVDLQALSNQQSTSCWVEDSSIVRGLTLSSQRIVRKPIATIHSLFSSSPSLLFPQGSGEQQAGIVRYEQEVTAILVLNGLPRDLTGSILAHEAMHAFLRLFNPPPPCSPSHPFRLPRDLEEGLCQLIAFHYLDYLSENRVRRSGAEEQEREEEELRGCFRYQISSDPSVVYGDSFRKVRKVQAVMGWPMLLEHLAQRSELPDIPDNDNPC